ncbi:MAG: DUF2029 domain-containing protein, partial [Chloroflexi bacterium]
MRTTGTRSAAGAILIVLALGLALRLIIAYVLPGSGFANDLASFRGWAHDLFTNGLYGFYARPGFHDYTPGYLYYLWVLGAVSQLLPSLDLVKIPAILSDLAIGWLIWSMVPELGGGRRAALFGAAIYLFVPISWFDSVVWGQVDSVGIVFLLLSIRALWREQPEVSSVLAVIAALIKPQLGIAIFIAGAVLLRRHLIDALADDRRSDQGSADDARTAAPLAARLVDRRGPIRLATSALAGLAAAIGLSLPFGLDLPGLIDQVFKTAGGYPYITVNAYNPWALVERAGSGLAASGQWLCDAVTGTAANTPCPPGSEILVAGQPAVFVAGVLMAVVLGAILLVVMWRPDRQTILVGTAVVAVALFVIPTRVHERYLFPFFAVGAILAAVSTRWRVAYAVLAVANFLNLYVVLTTLYPDNPQISDWLGIGDFVRSQIGVTLVALLHVGGFVWVALQLLPRGARRLSEEIASARTAARRFRTAAGRALPPASSPEPHLRALASGPTVPGAVLAAAAATPGSGSTPAGTTAAATASGPADSWVDEEDDGGCFKSWFGQRIAGSPLRADRSRSLRGELGGRLDRLDVWLLVVLVIASLGLRMWRLAEPYSMHFDEVYHARTATEFLQDWRYGIPHSIYEFTHPHLAKYAMALGIVAWGDDRVGATSDLGVHVDDAAIEDRWDDPTMPDHRAGDRLYVATGDAVRAYDLQTRELLATLPVAGASTVAVDEAGHRLFVGTRGGQVLELDTGSALDTLRIGGDPRLIDAPIPFGTFGAPIARLLVTPDGDFILAITKDAVVSMDASSGEVLGTAALEGAADLAPAGTVEGLVADTTALTDPAKEARTLADLLGGDAATYERRLTTTQGQEQGASRVVVSGSIDSTVRPQIDAAISDGSLAGITIQQIARVAVADTRGVTLISPVDASTTDEVPIAGGATGLALTSNLDAPRLYVAAGHVVTVVKLGTSDDPNANPIAETSIPMPGAVSRVTFDAASVMVHVLGDTPDGSAGTIYVIEPHGQSVYADARLPFRPTAWATDIDTQLPSADREAILAFDSAGTAVSVDVGHHAFAWRLPGVIAGALTSVFLYLLTRILFRRRSIGVLVAA